MSVCTLPTPTSPQIFSWCPKVNTVLFVSETHLILCRQSGQQVWSTKLLPPSPGASPVSISWSPDGQLFALVFDDGIYTVHQVSNGRQPMSFRPDPTKVMSLAWATTVNTTLSRPLKDYNHSSQGVKDECRTSVAAIGTVNGQLKVSVYGALSIGEIELNPNSNSPVTHVCVDYDTKEYAAIQGSHLYVYRMAEPTNNQSTMGPKRLTEIMDLLGYRDENAMRALQLQKAAKQSARSVELSVTLAQSCAKYMVLLKDAHKQNSTFFSAFAESKTSKPHEALLIAALYGTLDAVTLEWIQSQHEQGFIRWYKALSQSFDTLRKLLVDDILVCIEELLMVIGDLHGSGFDYISEAHELVFKLIADIIQGSQSFEAQACFMEHLYRRETDRPIAVTKLSKIPLGAVVESLVQQGPLLGIPAIEDSEKLVTLAAAMQASLDRAVQETRDFLRAQMKLSYAVDVGGPVSEIRPLQDGGYSLILDSGSIVKVQKSGMISAVDSIPRQGAVFTGRGDDIVSFVAEQKLLVLPDNTTKALEIEPIAIATRFDGEEVHVCVLSEDCQHYQFLTI